jgi:acyl carrier protein
MQAKQIVSAVLAVGSLAIVSSGCDRPPSPKPATESRPSAPQPSDVERRVKKIVAEQLRLKVDNLKPTDRFIEDLKADSLDVVELVMAVEEEFKLEIPDKEAEKMTTIGQVITFLKAKEK